ncbi:MAG: TRAP transporter fused permease subunit [Rhodospirillaceae bacterium]|jgi:TRAP transporter 4TM/12TM fusion protein|nr:TRAP transporter fused permease subunit [Rhodospirillaceae bacterium]MBT7267342.1 TRAP transporter fused permease subunit [Rhodospirillaceae bacterium]
MSDTEAPKTARLDNRALDLLVTILAVGLTLSSIAWAVDLYRDVGLQIYTEQYLGGMLMIALPLVYLAVPAGKGRYRQGAVPWYDILAGVVGAVVAAYTAYWYPELTEAIGRRPIEGLVVGGVMAVLLIEGLRRTVGMILTSVVLLFLALALLGDRLPGEMEGRPIDIEHLIYYLGWDSTSVLGTPMRIVTTIVVAFVFFGRILFISGGSEFFTDIAMVLMGKYRGGPAKISVFASSLFGSISGSTVSNVVTTGVVTIPLMRKGGYKAHHAGAIEAVASTGGQLMPPVMGASAFLMAEFLQIPYKEVVLAALIPAILFYVALFIQADLEAAKGNMEKIEESKIPAAVTVLKSGWFFPLPFIALVVALFVFNYSPELSALTAAAVVILATGTFGYKGKRLKFGDLFNALRGTGLGVIDIFMIGGCVGMVIGVLNLSGLGFALTLVLVQAAAGNLIVLLVLAAIVCIILGMGMPTVGVYVLLATLVAPALVEVGVVPIAAHLFILYFGMMSMITPPVAIGAFAAATLTGADPMRTGFSAMRFGWLAFVIPFMFVASPTLIMQGDVGFIIIDALGALAAAWLISVGMIGFYSQPLSALERLAYGLAGIGLIIPLNAFAGANEANIVGLILAIGLLSLEVRRRKT